MDKAAPRVRVTMTQDRIDRFTNWALRIGAYVMEKNGTIVESKKYRKYTPEQLAQARALSRAKQFLADKRAAEIIQQAREAGCETV